MKKKAAKPSKRTSSRVAKIAAKYFDMTNSQIAEELGLAFVFSSYDDAWAKFCKDVRALAASCLSQTEPKGKK